MFLTLHMLALWPMACRNASFLLSTAKSFLALLPPFPPRLFLTHWQSTFLDKGKEEISSSEQGKTAAEPRNKKPKRGSPEGLEKFYHCPGISNLEVKGVAPEEVKRVFLLVRSTKQSTLAEAFLCQYNCVYTGLLPVLQGSCGQGKEY